MPLLTALEMYSTAFNGRYPDKLEKVITPNYLTAIPTCPAAGSVTYTCEVSANPDRFTVTRQPRQASHESEQSGL